ncbi:class D sortase [Neobacillus terrae]|uniref:class D sortase n=1 Tax=Neobacillus terrae TaxID=3034837 RepID=UPI00140B0B15|nr:class D sortase [Neobacillus terrae]NHM30517.1 class D sortase [Neobacillus terrae]
MKFKTFLPWIIVIIGVGVLGTGIWQLTDSGIKEDTTLKKAKQVVASHNANTKTPAIQKKEFSPIKGDAIGILTLPKLKSELAVVEGTNGDDLKKGVGHYKGSFYPGGHGQIVLSGHRDTVFRRLGELKIGDTLQVKMPYGNYNYQIIKTKIVKADDRSIITLQNKEEELIVTTCYPFRYVGNAPKRYIIYAKPI